MKLVKMSLAAAMLMGASAYAVENINIYGEAKLWYQTTESNSIDLNPGTQGDFFEQGNAVDGTTGTSTGAGSAILGATADLTKSIKGTIEMSVFDTLGLENNLVSMIPSNISGAASVAQALETQAWASQANIAVTLGKTTAVLGRQELDTPLAFTEKWNATKNTFDAAVIVNSDIPDTTLVGAWVGKENSAWGGTVNYDGKFNTYGSSLNGAGLFTNASDTADGAYALGAVYAGLKGNTFQGWYYNVRDLAVAYWLQADGKFPLDDSMAISYGVQYADMSPDATALKDSDAYALKVGFDVAGVHMFAAYSDVSEGTLGFSNVTTQDKTKLYTGTASIYADGTHVAAPDTTAYKLGVKYTVADIKLGASYTSAENDGNIAAGGSTAASYDLTAWDLTAATTVAGIGVKAIYTQAEKDFYGNSASSWDFDALRVILTAKF